MTDFLRSVGLDRYDLNARLRPALFVLLPVLTTALFWMPEIRSIAGTIISLLSACGVLYFLSQAARQKGRAIERRLGERVGRAHSARLLTHTDTTINVETKARYHSYLRSHGRIILNIEEEIVNPQEALIRARSAVDWMLEYTRSGAKTSLLFDENIAYGFRRNLFGMKPIAIVLCILVLFVHGSLLWLRPLDQGYFWAGIMLAIAVAIFIPCWLFFITRSFVEDASEAYALRLFSFCENAPIELTASKSKATSQRPRRTSKPQA